MVPWRPRLSNDAEVRAKLIATSPPATASARASAFPVDHGLHAAYR